MFYYVVKRLLGAVLVLFGVTILAFGMLQPASRAIRCAS